MTNEQIKTYSLDGFKDGFEAATNGIAKCLHLQDDAKQDFLKAMRELQTLEMQRAAEIWDRAFLEVQKLKTANVG